MADNIVHPTSNTSTDVQHTKPLATPSVEKDEPSSAWASSTLDALGPISTETYPPDKPYNTYTAYASLPATPGDKFPGAYPTGINQDALHQDAEYVKEAAVHALETAKGYVQSAGGVVGGYLPKSVAAYLPNNTVRAEENVENTAEKLPGPHGEFLGDAQVPDEVGMTPQAVGIEGNRRPEDNSLVAHDSETMRDNQLNVDDKDSMTTSSRYDRDSTTASSRFVGASTNASTRSLAGSRADTWNHTPATSTNESQKEDMRNADGTMKTSSSASENLLAAENLQHESNTIHEKKEGQDGEERPDFEHHPDETRHINAPPVVTTTNSNFTAPHATSAATTGREHLGIINEEKKAPSATRPTAHQDSIGSNIATPGHETRGFLSTPAASGKEPVRNGEITAGTGWGHDQPTNAPSGTGTAGDIKNATFHAGTHNDDTLAQPTKTAAAATAAPNGVSSKDLGNAATTTTTTKDLPNTPNHNNNNIPTNGADNTSPAAPAATKSKIGSANGGGKPGFMDKLRGEMKIISGKLEHSTEKVEEGRRMMGKLPKT